MKGAQSEITDLVFKTLGGFAINQGAGFVFRKIGLADLLNPDPTQVKLEEIRQQLVLVSNQITTVQASVDQISRDLQQLKLDQAYSNVQAPIANTQYVFNYSFVPVLNAAIAVQKATPAAREAAIKTLDEKKADFLADFNSYQLGSAGSLIHNALSPNGVSTSIINAYGRVLMANDRFVTTQQSEVLADLATVFTEYEALAVWMKAEYTAAKNPDLLPGLITTEIDGWHTTETGSMPPVIPDDAVVDLGAIASTTTSTANRPMWVPQRQAAANTGNLPAFTWRPGDTTDARGVDQALARLNTSAPGGFTDWRTPTKTQVAALFSGFVRGHAPSLTTFNPAWRGYNNFQSFVWTSDQVSQSVECGQAPVFGDVPFVWNRKYQSYSGYWLNNAQPTNYNTLIWAPFPKLAARADGWSSNISEANAYKNCDAYAQSAFGSARGALLATRSTGTVEYFTQHLPPTPPTGGANGGANGGPRSGHHGRPGGR